MDAYASGRYMGFLASMLLFVTVLYFVTNKIGLHSLQYLHFAAGFAAVYFSIKFLKRVFRNA